jgi:hypothetical protein
MISPKAFLVAIAAITASTRSYADELSVLDGKLLPGDPNQPTYIDLKPEREQER